MLDENEGELPEEAIADDVEQIEDDVDTQSEDDADATEEADQDTLGEDPDNLVEILVGDKAEKLSKAEIAKRMMLHADYTRKTQEAAEKGRQWDADVALSRQAIASEISGLQEWLEFYQANQQAAPDFIAIAREKGPGAAYQAELEWKGEQVKIDQAKAIHQQIQRQEFDRNQEAFARDVRRDFPEWTDPVVMKGDIDAIYKVAADYGFAQGDIETTQDIKVLKVLRDAAKYRAMQDQKPEIARRVASVMKTSPAKAAPAQGSSEARRAQAAREAFRASPTIANAVKNLDF